MRLAPIQMAATLDTFRTIVTVGNISAISRPAASDVVVSSPLAAPNRALSSGSRTKARTTRMPVICSRSTWFTRSMRTCMSRNCGIIREITRPMAMSRTGMLTSSRRDSPPSSRTARMTPPMAVTGAAMRSVQVMKSSICTCCTSLVMRVMSDGAPNALTSRVEKPVTRWNRPARTSRPNPIDAREP